MARRGLGRNSEPQGCRGPPSKAIYLCLEMSLLKRYLPGAGQPTERLVLIQEVAIQESRDGNLYGQNPVLADPKGPARFRLFSRAIVTSVTSRALPHPSWKGFLTSWERADFAFSRDAQPTLRSGPCLPKPHFQS